MCWAFGPYHSPSAACLTDIWIPTPAHCPLAGLLNRPLEVTDATQLKIRVLQFMIRVNEVESLGKICFIRMSWLIPVQFQYFLNHSADVSFGADQISPLESALRLLESINHDFNIPQQDYKNVCTSIKELVRIFVLPFFLLVVMLIIFFLSKLIKKCLDLFVWSVISLLTLYH